MKNVRPTQWGKRVQKTFYHSNHPFLQRTRQSRGNSSSQETNKKISWTDGMQKTWNRCICRDVFVHELFSEDYKRDIKEVTTAQPMVKSNLSNRGWPGRGFIQGNQPRCHRAVKILWQCQGWISHGTLRSSRSLRLICSTLIYDLLVAWIGRVVLQLN